MIKRPATAWRSVRKTLNRLGLGWAWGRLPAQLRVPRSADFPLGVETSQLLPREYNDFTGEVGYPVVGFRYYCGIGLTFLPPEHLETCSALVASARGATLRPSKKMRPAAKAAFFAGTELSDLVGYAFAPRGNDGPIVWRVEGMVTEPLGPFAPWAIAEAAQIEAYATSLSKEERMVLQKENESEGDPHRALDYALDLASTHKRFSKADLSLHWVVDETTTPYRYGVIDDGGQWRLEPREFDSVGPFRNGKARVELDDQVLLIDLEGRVVKNVTPRPKGPNAARISLTGKRVTVLGSFRVVGISLGELMDRVAALGGTFVSARELADVYAVSEVPSHFPELLEAAKQRAATTAGVELVPLAKFVEQVGL